MSFNIWNNLDEMALFLGLTRLDSESNEDFFNRIKAFSRWKYKTDYYTQAHSIPLQLGLKTDSIMKILSTYKYECTIDWEFFYLKNEIENIRVYIGADATLQKVLDAINASSTFTYKLYDDLAGSIDFKYIIRNKNIKTGEDFIDEPRVTLENKDIIQGTVKCLENGILITEKSSLLELKKQGDYFVDYKTGYLEIFHPNFLQATIFYRYYDPVFYIESTELNLKPTNLEFKYGLVDGNVDTVKRLLSGKVWGT